MNGPILTRSPATNLDQLGVIEQPMLFEFALDVGEREFGAVDRNVQLGKDRGQSANVIFMTMREDDGTNMITVLEQIGDVGNDDIDAQEFGFGEHQSGVDDDDVIGPADGHAVHPELAQAAERNDMEFSGRHQNT